MDTVQDAMPLYAEHAQPIAGKSLEEKIQELADREEIRQLIALYAQRVNHGHGVADLFTEDAEWTMRSPQSDSVTEIKGGEGLRAAFSSFSGGGAVAPMIHNLVIKVTGDTARAIDMNDLWSSRDGKRYHAWGNYEDSFRRENGRWLFTARHMTFTQWQEIDD